MEIKRQNPSGNAHERACRYMMPGIIESARVIANQPKGVIPFWWIWANGLASHHDYIQHITHWFMGIEGHMLLWRNLHDWEAVADHFEKHIRPLLL